MIFGKRPEGQINPIQILNNIQGNYKDFRQSGSRIICSDSNAVKLKRLLEKRRRQKMDPKRFEFEFKIPVENNLDKRNCNWITFEQEKIWKKIKYSQSFFRFRL